MSLLMLLRKLIAKTLTLTLADAARNTITTAESLQSTITVSEGTADG